MKKRKEVRKYKTKIEGLKYIHQDEKKLENLELQNQNRI